MRSGFDPTVSLRPVPLGHSQPLAKSCSAGRRLIMPSLLVCNLDQIGIWDYGCSARIWQASVIDSCNPRISIRLDLKWRSVFPLHIRGEEALSEEVDFCATISY